MMKIGRRQRLIGRSRFTEVEVLEERSQRRQPPILTWEKEKKLLAVVPPMVRALVVLLIEAGLRIGREALSLKWQDVDFFSGSIIVRESKTLAGRSFIPLSKVCKAELLSGGVPLDQVHCHAEPGGMSRARSGYKTSGISLTPQKPRLGKTGFY
jgi:integrase